MTACEILIVGAGISGLMAASHLSSQGRQVIVLEKSRGLGGRMATRREFDAIFDTGAQFFTARNEAFRNAVRQWEAAGAATAWFSTPGAAAEDPPHVRYRGAPSMTAPAKHLAEKLTIQREDRVIRSSLHDGTWIVETAHGATYEADFLILSLPVPQALEILRAGDVELPGSGGEDLGRVRYHSCLAVMASLKEPSGLTAPGCIRLDSQPLRFLADNQTKGVSPIPAMTLHSSPEFAREAWDWDDGKIIDALIGAAKGFVDAQALDARVHRWKYADTDIAYGGPGDGCYLNLDLGLAVVGDAFIAGRVEGAALSGLIAARQIATAYTPS